MTSFPGKQRIEYIDGLRGVAVLLVVVFHAAIWSGLDRQGLLFHLCAIGRCGVDIFLVLSGFCLFYPLQNRDGTVGYFESGDYLRRRLKRIVPPYYFAILLVTMASFLVYEIADGQEKGIQFLFPVNMKLQAANLISHLTLTHGLNEYTAHGFDGAFWSISLEWQFYLLFIPLVAMARKSVMLSILIPVSITMLYRFFFWLVAPDFLETYVGSEISIGRWMEFALGMAAASLIARGFSTKTKTWHRRLLYGVSIILILASLFYDYASSGLGVFLPMLWSLSIFGVILSIDARACLMEKVSGGGLIYVGKISYSLYLIHGTAMMLVALAITKLTEKGVLREAMIFSLGPVFSLILAIYFFRYCEFRFLSRHARVDIQKSPGTEQPD